MKKWICITLALVLVLGLCACNTSDGSAAGFRVGYGCAVATPDHEVYLAGYANDKDRMSEGVLSDLKITCVAITDEKDNTVLLFGLDLMKMEHALAEPYISAISEATGVPEDNIILSASHSHSSHSLGNQYGLNTPEGQQYREDLLKAAKQAMEDRGTAEVKIASKQVENMNFVRHYTTDTGIVVGDNFDSGGYTTLTGHTTESDNQLQLICFQRADKKDIVMINWQGHPTLSSTSMVGAKDKYYLVSADYVGVVRDYVESELDCYTAFYLGASGNLNAYSRIKSENISTDYKKYGENLGEQIVEGVGEAKSAAVGELKTKRYDFGVKLPSGGDTTVELNTYTIGDLAFATTPYEMFDTHGMTVKNGSPFPMTMMITMTNYYLSYVPSEAAFDYPNCYEVRSTRFAKGTGEAVADELVRQLTEMKG